ncbi:hypothetical protein LOZ53_004346 [Ophidiomyces ophidiicola]|nr:hypothetical protein LOZ62_004014 [Ophidiomyces ophidiicola]KAI1947642.1 hypothetical protein LOZ59_006585 [Ophidiomyces ophidiicola]KAI1970699.1 hypothetical protein LOZ56_003548 [Ophidiomyces ophidiicola]KAI1978729.1 hypothetical protein LOZ55_002439 [Ophidiomyces ophidiicola]KAI1987477.1 hypothetical protein LOZ53_004346 [Ophidiomyces ophidiicola]
MPFQRKAYPTPLTIPPLTHHTHTLILLHGRGSNAERFGLELLQSTSLPAQLPSVRFIFPTASKRKATVLKKMPINQWFDNYSLEDPNERPDLQVTGLCETAAYLRALIEKEAEILGPRGYNRIILGGLSQGCAASVITLIGGGLGPEGNEELGGFIGMSGWLPFEKQLRDLTQPAGDDEDDASPFGQDTCDEGEEGHQAFHALNHIRDILDLPELAPEELSPGQPPGYLAIPAFIGHGFLDPKVSVRLGEGLATFMSKALQMDVTWKPYEELGHWYSVPDEIDDIVQFLSKNVGVPVNKDLPKA